MMRESYKKATTHPVSSDRGEEKKERRYRIWMIKKKKERQ